MKEEDHGISVGFDNDGMKGQSEELKVIVELLLVDYTLKILKLR